MNSILRFSKILWTVYLFAFCTNSCKKFVEIPAPKNLIADENVFTSDATAIAVLTGIYTNMSNSAGAGANGGFTGAGSISLMAGFSSDELDLYSGVSFENYKAYYQNNLSVEAPAGGFEHWSPIYNYIYKCNAAIEALTNAGADALTPAVKQQLLGEAKFLRAFFYFYLVNLYGDVPMALVTEYKINAAMARTSRDLAYQQMITDLQEAQTLLAIGYIDASLVKSSPERVRPTKSAANALLARVYLYGADYVNAETQATAVISDIALFNLTALNDAFERNSKEAIWQLQPVTIGHNTEDGWIFVLPTSGPSDNIGSAFYPAYLSTQLLNSFEADDERAMLGNWVNNITVSGITYYYPYKYKSATLNAPVTEYLMVLRLAEQYLIRAEARAQQNKISEAQADLNAIRTRAGLPNTTADDKPSLLTAILHERQVELFTEWGHRWFDLKRTGAIDSVMTTVTPLKASGAAWQPYQQLYPLPLIDLQRNTNLVQNTGYN